MSDDGMSSGVGVPSSVDGGGSGVSRNGGGGGGSVRGGAGEAAGGGASGSVSGKAPARPEAIKVFLTGVDSYWGKWVGEYVSTFSYTGFDGLGGDDDDDRSYGTSRGGGADDDASIEKAPVRIDVYGTLSKEDGVRPTWCKGVVPKDRAVMREFLNDVDVIVYDVVSDVDEATWLIDDLAAAADSWSRPKTFIAVSTVLTWAKTKAGGEDEDDDAATLTEEDYKRRKPHTNFKPHINVEKLVIKWSSHKKNLKGYVLAHGLLYGEGEDIFHFLFKSAWHGVPRVLPCIGGRNILPTMHVCDMAQVLARVIADPPEIRYIVAVDESRHTAEEIVTEISKELGTGLVKRVKADDALLLRAVSAVHLDMLQVNLTISPAFILDMGLEWRCEGGLIENLPLVIQEYKKTRGLTALKVFIQGPPAGGKSYLAAKIAQEYKIHHVRISDCIKDYEQFIRKSDDSEELQNQLNEAKEENGNRIPDDLLVVAVRMKLRSKPCQNQGFVLDGFPKSLEQADLLFRLPDDEPIPEETIGTNLEGLDTSILPDHVIVVEAADDFLKERVMNLPEADVVDTHNNEEDFKRRLTLYRKTNNEEEAVWDFFDGREVMPITLQGADAAEDSLKVVRKALGTPHNYGPTPEEKAAKAAAKAEEEAKVHEAELAKKAVAERLESEARAKHELEWEQRLASVRDQERVLLEHRALPLRQYLMDAVMPSLTRGLIEVCKVRPDDPIDYLAEYLFKANPAEEAHV